MAEAAKDLGLKPDDELLSGDDRLVRDMVAKAETKVPREEG